MIQRNASEALLLKSIETIFAGELWVPRAVLSQMVRTSLGNNPLKLTSRETEILDMITRGLKNQEIADLLFISRETVRWHIRSLYSKIGVGPRFGEGSISRTDLGPRAYISTLK